MSILGRTAKTAFWAAALGATIGTAIAVTAPFFQALPPVFLGLSALQLITIGFPTIGMALGGALISLQRHHSDVSHDLDAL